MGFRVESLHDAGVAPASSSAAAFAPPRPLQRLAGDPGGRIEDRRRHPCAVHGACRLGVHRDRGQVRERAVEFALRGLYSTARRGTLYTA